MWTHVLILLHMRPWVVKGGRAHILQLSLSYKENSHHLAWMQTLATFRHQMGILTGRFRM